ncbi:MAG: polysaccharide biosynthesis protein [Rhodospirillales bacterium]|nr:polysaccharide biosynthesis protein [Rhodospirillales bacterium]
MEPIEPNPPSAIAEAIVDQSLGKRVAKGAAWMVLKRLAFKGIGLISTLILVRLLAPDAFGLAAIASTAYDALNAVSDLSFALALVKMKEPTRAQYDTAWTLTLLRGFAIGGLIYLSAPWIAEVMREPRLVNITRVMALYPIIWGFENIGLIDFQRDLRFDRLFVYDVLGKVAGFVVVVPAALILHNAWAVVLGTIAPKIVQVPASYIMHPYRPGISFKAGGELLSFSKWLFATNILSLANNYLITILIGRIGGAASVGLFRTAEQIGILPVSEVAAPIRGPMYAGYAKVMNDRDRLCRHVVDGLSLTLMIITPLSIGIMLVAKLIEQVALGAEWAGAAVFIQVCAFYALFEGISEFTHNLYVVKDRQRRFVAIMTLTVVIRVVLVVWAGFTYGVLWAAIMFALTSFFGSVIWFGQLTVMIHLSVRRVLAAVWRIVMATAIMSAGVFYFLSTWPYGATMPGRIAELILAIALGGVLYIGPLLGLWVLCGRPAGPEDHAAKAIPQLLARLGMGAEKPVIAG